MPKHRFRVLKRNVDTTLLELGTVHRPHESIADTIVRRSAIRIVGDVRTQWDANLNDCV
jgi:hypothetical protein